MVATSPPELPKPSKTFKNHGETIFFKDDFLEKPIFLFSWIGPFPMVPGVNPIQLDVQNPNLRSKSMENLEKLKNQVF